MTREAATKLAHEELQKHGLTDWHIRLTTNLNHPFLGLCSYRDKCIILNAHHLDSHPDPEILNTIRHEIAHALCPKQGHNDVWRDKAIEVGCTNTAPCSHLSFSPEIVDAIRSGADIQVTYETEVIHRPRYQVTRLQDKCEVCGKVAKTKNETLIEDKDLTKPDKKFIFLECGHLIIREIPKGTPFQTLTSDDGIKKPYPFQIDGMKFVEAALSVNKGVGIFDEMGLGKTIQSLGYLKFHPECAPVLFIVKSGIKFQWFKEILTWMGPEWVPQIIENSQDILFPNLKAYIISYDMLVFKQRKSKRGKLITQGFDITKFEGKIKTVVLDECQQIKNPDSSRTQQVRRICKDCKVIALSGTPWKNRGSEYFPVLNMLAPMKFPSNQQFLDRWVSYYHHGSYLKQGGIADIESFKYYTKDILIRREREEVMKELPLINRVLQFTDLDLINQEQYDEEVSDFVKWYNNKVIGGEEDDFDTSSNILAKLARMRHITGLAKIPATEEFVEDFVEETERKLCIFVHHKDVGDILYRNLQKKYGSEMKIMKLTADMSPLERFQAQEEFNKEKRAILIGSTLASGEGLNLQTCADCIMHERQWNPANEEQAEGRFIRIGQQHDSVTATYMTAAGTVDEIIAEIVDRKRVEFHNAMNKGQMPTWKQNELVKEIADRIVKDASKSITKKASIAR